MTKFAPQNAPTLLNQPSETGKTAKFRPKKTATCNSAQKKERGCKMKKYLTDENVKKLTEIAVTLKTKGHLLNVDEVEMIGEEVEEIANETLEEERGVVLSYWDIFGLKHELLSLQRVLSERIEKVREVEDEFLNRKKKDSQPC